MARLAKFAFFDHDRLPHDLQTSRGRRNEMVASWVGVHPRDVDQRQQKRYRAPEAPVEWAGEDEVPRISPTRARGGILGPVSLPQWGTEEC